MRYDVLRRDPHEFSDDEFREYARLCNGEFVSIYLGAAVEYVEKFAEISLRKMQIIAKTKGGKVRLPFRSIKHIDRVMVVSGHGVPMTTTAPKLNSDCIMLDELPVCASGHSFYEVKYTTSPVPMTDGIKLAVWEAALDLYDGNPVRDLEQHLTDFMAGKNARFIEAVGGTNLRII